MNGNDMNTGAETDRAGPLAMLDAYGARLERWPDAAQAGAARRRLLVDRQFRAEWEGARSLDDGLGTLRAELDAAIARDGAAARVRGGVMARLPRALDGVRWRSLAAAMLLAAFLGGAIQALRPAAHAEPISAVLLDPTLPELGETRF